jgi:CRP/FNR family transcriptional regulator, cyclic AMP receptor protein
MAINPFQNFMVRYGANERIFTEGDLGTTMYIVQSGKVRLFRMLEGQKRIHGMMDKGDFFGEMSILEALPRTISAEAVEDTELIEINSMTFDKMIKGNIEIAIRMLRKLSIRLRETERRLEGLQTDSRAGVPVRPAAPQKPKAQAAAGSGARLEVDGEGTPFYLQDNETLIGRFDPVTEQMPDIDLTQVDLKRSVSRRHARLVRASEGFSLTEEVGALNGTFVNSTKLVTGRAHPVQDGDRISVGMVKLVFRI